MSEIRKGLRPPNGRPAKRSKLPGLIALADRMEVGDAAVLSLSDSQTFRVVLAAKGFLCLTDGDHCEVRGKTLAFKLNADPATERKNYEHCSIHEYSETRPARESNP